LLAAGVGQAPGLAKVARRWSGVQGYFRIRDHSLLPSLKDTDLLLLDGEYLELEPDPKPLLTLIPPARFGPPEKVWTDKVETEKPGLLLAESGKGRLAYIPWDVGGLYYRLSSAGHRGLVADLIDHLLPEGRQLKTNAHPLVEISVMRQPKHPRTLVHFINLSGHSQTAYFEPIPMRDIRVELAGEFRSARSLHLGQDLSVTQQGRYTGFLLPNLESYEIVVIE
jgi:hypothetical protein